ncbi:hypothetical protein ES707_06739 [subsurface metagenome]
MEKEKALENLKLILTSPNPRPPSTVTSYLSSSNLFLTWLDGKLPPDDMDVRRYFVNRRSLGQKESTLSKTFQVLKRLFEANEWEWKFTNRDRPEVPVEYITPAFTQGEVAQLIRKRDLYTHNECFYLATASVYGPRRIELARIGPKSIRGNSLFVDTAKKGEKRTHLIPEELMPYFKAYHPREHNVSALSATFNRVVKKAGLPQRKGYGWHTFRHTLDTLLPTACAKADIPLTFVGYFLRWSRKSWGARILGAAMAGAYARPEILSDDPFYIDKQIFSVHPFLPLWVESGQ